ncbi:MAG: hypothetical protein WDO18_21575 [Acidobacteriota bacterium]
MSANRRYLVDQNNTPVLIAGDSPHAMIPTLTLGAADTFLTSRQAARIQYDVGANVLLPL